MLRRSIHALWLTTLRASWRKFLDAASDPATAQLGRLRALVGANAATAWGRAHAFERVTSLARWQSRVPISDYAAVAPFIDRVAAGEPAVLTAEPVLMLERTSGSGGQNKLVPYTRGLLAEFSAATGPWLSDLYTRRPALRGTTSYWAISPAARQAERSAGGLPIGLPDDTAYFGPLERWAIRRTLAVPPEVARLPSIPAWRRATAQHLLADADLGLVSVWSPTFLTALLRDLERDLDPLLAGVPAARANDVRRRLDAAGRFSAEALWPRLAVVSCWADGASARFLPELRSYIPVTPIQPKGLLATEGVVSFPLWGHPGAVLAVAGAFLELQDVDHPAAPPLLAHEAREGAEYAPLLTTAGGLYRYRLGDVVRVVGRFRRAPLVRFVGRLDRTSDLCGEKVTARDVEAGLARAEPALGAPLRFALVAPDPASAPPAYVLYAESDAPDAALAALADRLEAHLRAAHHYRYCRDLGQLGPLRWQRVHDGAARYTAALVARGVKAGDVKPAALDARAFWAAALVDNPPVNPATRAPLS